MARQPDDLVLRVLKNIQRTQAEHSKRLDRIEKALEDVLDGVVTALGLATHANVRHEAVDKRLEQLRVRIDRLEKKR
jgi:hypothetical protein